MVCKIYGYEKAALTCWLPCGTKVSVGNIEIVGFNLDYAKKLLDGQHSRNCNILLKHGGPVRPVIDC